MRTESVVPRTRTAAAASGGSRPAIIGAGPARPARTAGGLFEGRGAALERGPRDWFGGGRQLQPGQVEESARGARADAGLAELTRELREGLALLRERRGRVQQTQRLASERRARQRALVELGHHGAAERDVG